MPSPVAMRAALRWSMVVAYGFATLEPPGIHAGTLDELFRRCGMARPPVP